MTPTPESKLALARGLSAALPLRIREAVERVREARAAEASVLAEGVKEKP